MPLFQRQKEVLKPEVQFFRYRITISNPARFKDFMKYLDSWVPTMRLSDQITGMETVQIAHSTSVVQFIATPKAARMLGRLKAITSGPDLISQQAVKDIKSVSWRS